MMKYDLVNPDHEMLSTRLEDFDFTDPPIDPAELADDLFEIAKKTNAAGISANQLGLPYRLCVINSTPVLNMYNPSITYYNDTYVVDTEGCLSHPALYIKIRRPDAIRVKYFDKDGQAQISKLKGEVARVVQHEVDHLNGIDFRDRASAINLKKGTRKQKAMKKKLKKLGL